MSLHQYYCYDCESEFELNIGLIEGNYILYVWPTEKEYKEIWDRGDDPRDFIKEYPLGKELPMHPPCPLCASESCDTDKLVHDTNGYVKGNCFTNRERERRFYEKGMDKQQATEFYKESMRASKERINSGHQHYKQVAPDLDVLRKNGKIKKVNDKKKAERIESIKKMNQHLTKLTDTIRPKKD